MSSAYGRLIKDTATRFAVRRGGDKSLSRPRRHRPPSCMRADPRARSFIGPPSLTTCTRGAPWRRSSWWLPTRPLPCWAARARRIQLLKLDDSKEPFRFASFRLVRPAIPDASDSFRFVSGNIRTTTDPIHKSSVSYRFSNEPFRFGSIRFGVLDSIPIPFCDNVVLT